jgi:prefoldin subunit 5
MKIYAQEILDGVAEAINSHSSIAYCSPAIISDSQHTSPSYIEKIKASSANPKQIDLYYIKSVLVSTGWNKNDDVFAPEQTWAARRSPEDKQFNFMHNENDIIGHITGSYVTTKDGSTVAEDGESFPSDFDIITEAVIYNSWTNPENRERMSKIIQEIEEGKWFVSMECLFAGFDYAVVDNRGNAKVVARSEDSAFLTKHLRAYGGTGEYEGYKIGRSLRDISFSGKGLVSKPANPRSIILDASKAFSVRETSLIGNTSLGEKNMSENILEKQLADVRGELASAKEENKAIRAQIEAAKDKEYAETISGFEDTVKTQAETIKTLEEQVQALNNTISDLNATITARDEQLTSLTAAVEDMKKTERNRGRKDMLVKAGFEEAEAEESLNLYDNLDDTTFDSIVAMYKKQKSKYMMKKEDKEEKPMMEKKTAEVDSVEKTEAEVTPELLEGLETSEATLVDASNDSDELESTRASVAAWIEENVLRK